MQEVTALCLCKYSLRVLLLPFSATGVVQLLVFFLPRELTLRR